MTRDCIDIRPAASLDDAANSMWEGDCGALPVVDEQHAAVGMVTDRDICMCAHHEGKSLGELKVADAMSSDLVACKEEDDVAAAQRKMGEAQVRRLPVLDSDGRLSGVLALAEIARAGDDGKVRDVSNDQVGEMVAAISRPNAASESSGTKPASRGRLT